MAEVSEEGTGSGGEASPKRAAEAAMVERLGRIEQSMANQPTLTKVLQDPDVMAVLRAKQEGKKIKVMAEDEVEAQRQQAASRSPFEGKSDEDVEKMNSKELASFILEAAKQSTGSASEASIKKLLDPLIKRLDGLEGYTQQKEALNVQQTIKQVAAKNIDFEEHRSSMIEIQKQNPGASVDELLVLARMRAGKDPKGPKPSGLQSERPSGGLGKAKREKKEYIGQQGMNQLLAEALKDKDFFAEEGE